MGDASRAVELAKGLQHQDAGARLEAARGLAALGPDAAGPHARTVAERLHDAHSQRRAEAALEQMGEAGADALASRLSDPDDGVRNGAVEALKTMGSVGAAGLAKQLADPDEYRWRTAALALTEMGMVGVSQLGRRVEDSNMQVQMTAAWALGTAGTLAEPHLPALSRLVLSEDEDVRRIAAAALEALACHGSAVFVAGLLGEAGEVRERRVQEALRCLGRPGAQACADRLGETDAAYRARAARALQALESYGAGALAEKIAAGEGHGCSKDVRRKAAETLGHMSPEFVAPYCRQLAQRLEDEDSWVRTHAARALGAQGERAAGYAAAIAARLDDGNPLVQKSVARALGCLAPSSAEAGAVAAMSAQALAGQLEDPEYSVRRRAGELLEEMGAVGAAALSGRSDKRSAYMN